MNDQFKIKDEASFRDFFTMIPNMVDDMNLSPQAFRLYIHFRRVAGEDRSCYQSIKTLAEKCNMSTGMVSQAKHELVEADLIRSETKVGPNGNYSDVTIKDIWKENHDRGVSQNMGKGVHIMGDPSPQYETNNIKNNISNTTENLHFTTDEELEKFKEYSKSYGKPKPEKKPKVSLSQKDYADADSVVQSVVFSSSNAKGSAALPERYLQQVSWFTQYSGLEYFVSQKSKWISAFEDWDKIGVVEEDVMKAVDKLRKLNYSITSPQSLTNVMNGIVAERKAKPEQSETHYNPWR